MSDGQCKKRHVVVIGAGFTGLAAAYELARRGIKVTVLEKDDQIGGLAGSFKINGCHIEKFYHHFFNNDEHVIKLAKELGCENELLRCVTKTGIYFDRRFFKLSTPMDVLQFKPLSLLNRIRLGLLILRAQRVKDWKPLDTITAEQWLLKLCGAEAYKIVWEPLLRGKFGPYASQVSAAWFWNKLILRGGSRSKTGAEMLVYYHGGFGAFAETIAAQIRAAGSKIQTGTRADGLAVEDGCIKAVKTSNGTIDADAVIATPALPIIAELVEPHVSNEYVEKLRSIKYLANMCLVLELSHNLSDIYWLNVNDAGFPFVGVIEHTNFQSAESCGGKHIVYLSKYLLQTDEPYKMSKEQVFELALPHIKRMFPRFDGSWVLRYHVWKAPYAQPFVGRNYSSLIPANQTPIKGFYTATMAQVYPQDRGINYAVRDGRSIGQSVAKVFESETAK
jgi:protoporphyrinogen oxidase